MKQRFVAFTVLILSTLPFLVSAANTGSGTLLKTGTGSTLSGTTMHLTAKQADTHGDDRARRIREFALSAPLWNAAWNTWKAFSVKEDALLMQTRSLCRNQTRQANRDTLFDIQKQCVRTELATWRAGLLKQELYLKAFPDVSTGMINVYVQQSRLLGTALGAVTTAIDSGVFHTGDELLSAKKNLRLKYLTPLENMQTLILRSRLDHWTSMIIKDMDLTDSGATVLDRASWDSARTCFTDSEGFTTTKIPTIQDRSAALLKCIDMANLSVKLQMPPVAMSGSTLTGSLIPKK